MTDYNYLTEEKLREASSFGDIELIKRLVSIHVNVNSKNKVNGWTALHWAAYRNNFDVVKLLLTFGADKNSLNHKNETPADLTTFTNIKELLGRNASSGKQYPLPIIPNYLRNPPIQVACDDFLKMHPTKKLMHDPKTTESESDLLSLSKNENIEVNSNSRTQSSCSDYLIIKVRVVEANDKDFIEVELPKSELNLESLKKICCTELNLSAERVKKIRKLPNVIVRKNRDVERLKDFDELELVLDTFQTYIPLK